MKLISMKMSYVGGALLILSQSIFAQDRIVEREDSSRGLPTQPDITRMNQLPDDAKIKYGVGNAPLFARVMAYAVFLDRIVNRGQQSTLLHEAEELGIPAENLEVVRNEIVKYAKLRDEEHSAILSQECQPYREGGDITAASARQSLERLGSSDERQNALAQSVLDGLDLVLSPGISEKVKDRINNRGESLDYTKVELVRFVEAVSDYESYLTAACNSI